MSKRMERYRRALVRGIGRDLDERDSLIKRALQAEERAHQKRWYIKQIDKMAALEREAEATRREIDALAAEADLLSAEVDRRLKQMSDVSSVLKSMSH